MWLTPSPVGTVVEAGQQDIEEAHAGNKEQDTKRRGAGTEHGPAGRRGGAGRGYGWRGDA